MHFISLVTGKTSDEVGMMSENEPEALDTFLKAQEKDLKTFTFKLRSKFEKYGIEAITKYTTVQHIEKVNQKEYDDYLIENIQRLTGVGK